MKMKLRKIPSIIETKLKILETYLTKGIQNLYSENQKILLKQRKPK